FWLEMATCSSSAFSTGSWKISHHLPRITPSLGWASFHPCGGASLNAGGTGAAGCLYLGPTMQPPDKTAATIITPARDGRLRAMNYASDPIGGGVDSGLIPRTRYHHCWMRSK